jgi:hypothetical protein
MHLTVHPTNTSAVAFYRGLGWVELKEPNGTWVGRMTLSLVGDADKAALQSDED